MHRERPAQNLGSDDGDLHLVQRIDWIGTVEYLDRICKSAHHSRAAPGKYRSQCVCVSHCTDDRPDNIIEVDDDADPRAARGGQNAGSTPSRGTPLGDIGFLAANLAQNPNDITSGVMYEINAHLYRTEEVNGVRLEAGPRRRLVQMFSRELYDRAGGLTEHGYPFWQEDGVLLQRLAPSATAAHV